MIDFKRQKGAKGRQLWGPKGAKIDSMSRIPKFDPTMTPPTSNPNNLSGSSSRKQKKRMQSTKQTKVVQVEVTVRVGPDPLPPNPNGCSGREIGVQGLKFCRVSEEKNKGNFQFFFGGSMVYHRPAKAAKKTF